jgi:hypothetical protein
MSLPKEAPYRDLSVRASAALLGSSSTYRTTLEESGHGPAEEAVGISHPQQISVFRLGKDTEVHRRDVLISGVADGCAVLHELQHGEFLPHLGPEFFQDLVFGPAAFLFDVQTAEVDVVLSLPASEAGDSASVSIYLNGSP